MERVVSFFCSETLNFGKSSLSSQITQLCVGDRPNLRGGGGNASVGFA